MPQAPVRGSELEEIIGHSHPTALSLSFRMCHVPSLTPICTMQRCIYTCPCPLARIQVNYSFHHHNKHQREGVLTFSQTNPPRLWQTEMVGRSLCVYQQSLTGLTLDIMCRLLEIPFWLFCRVYCIGRAELAIMKSRSSCSELSIGLTRPVNRCS